MSSSYTFFIEKFNKQFTISSKFIELVKNKADILGLDYRVEEIAN